MLEQKHINVIRVCLKTMRAFGNDKSKSDIEEALKAFDDTMKTKEIKFDENDLNICPMCNNYVKTDDNYCWHCGQKIKLR
jgi:hypothetical protein